MSASSQGGSSGGGGKGSGSSGGGGGGGNGGLFGLSPQATSGLGQLTSGAGAAYGAYAQSQANAANLVAAQAHNQLIQSYVNQYLQPQQSPYANAMLQFMGAGPPGTTQQGGASGGPPPGTVGGGVSLPPPAPPGAPGGPPGPPHLSYQQQAPPNSITGMLAGYQAQPIGAAAAGMAPQGLLGSGGAGAPAMPAGYSASANMAPQGLLGQGAAAGTQGMNAGQDGLMQALTRRIAAPPPPQGGYPAGQTPPLTGQPTGGGGAGVSTVNPGLPVGTPPPATGNTTAPPPPTGGQVNLGGNTAYTYNPLVPFTYSAAGVGGMNPAGSYQAQGFNTSPEEQAVNNLNMQNLQLQENALQGSAGSLGQRFGTALNYNQGQLANQALTANAAQLQQIAQSSFNTQQAQTLQGQLANQASLNQAGQFNAAAGQTMSAQNAQQGNIYNNLMTSILGNAQNAQGQQGSANTSLLGLIAGLGVPQVQGSPYGAAAGQIGSIATLYPFLQQLLSQQGGGQTPTQPNTTPLGAG